MTKRFTPLKSYKGIRKDNSNGKYQARKFLNGKEYSETFKKLSDALKWRNSFHPDLVKEVSCSFSQIDNTKHNGVETRFRMEDVWSLYKKQHLPSISRQSQIDTVRRANNIVPDLFSLRMVDINAVVIDDVISAKVKVARIKSDSRRYSFDKELQTLRAILNWYRENYDAMFVVPILKRHFISGTLTKKIDGKSKKMTKEQVQRFFDSLESQFWKDFSQIHFFMAGRVQEPAGLQVESVDFENRVLTICDVSVWGHNKKFMYLKEIPKNGEERLVFLNDTMVEILKRRLKDTRTDACEFFRESDGNRLNFLFNMKGQPLTYRQIQHQYNKALKLAGLWPEFRATHILRKAMANIVRQAMGLEAAQAVGGWKSRDIVEKIYTDSAPTKLNRDAVNFVGNLMLTGTNRIKSL